jgi:hypothetical protein
MIATTTFAVIPVLVTGIHRAICSGACGWLDPGHKARDDNLVLPDLNPATDRD